MEMFFLAQQEAFESIDITGRHMHSDVVSAVENLLAAFS